MISVDKKSNLSEEHPYLLYHCFFSPTINRNFSVICLLFHWVFSSAKSNALRCYIVISWFYYVDGGKETGRQMDDPRSR